MRKSFAAGLSLAKRRTVSSEYVMPWGLEYFGTHQIALMESSLLTKSSTISISGPVGSMGILIISIPKYSVMVKCLSYPGTGHRNFTLSSLHHGVLPITPWVMDLETVSYIIFRLEFP